MNNYKTTEAYKAMEEWQQKEVDKHFDLFNKVGEGRTQNGRHPWKEQTVSFLLYQLNKIIQENGTNKKLTIESLYNEGTELDWAKDLVAIEGGRTRIKYNKGYYMDEQGNKQYGEIKEDWYLYTRAGN